MAGPPLHGRIVLADDHEGLLHEVRALLAPEFEVLDAVTTGTALIVAARGLRPDVVISDIQMPGVDGIEACCRILQEGSCRAAIILTMYKHSELVSEALERGIRGYVLKVDAGEELIPAVHSILGGGTYLSRGVQKSQNKA